MFQVDLTENMNTFFYATKIPISVVKNGQIDRSCPSGLKTASSLLFGDLLPHAAYRAQEYNAIQYAAGSFGERFLIDVLDDTYTVAAGPVLTEPMGSGPLDAVVRDRRIPIKLKSKLEQYFQNVGRISPQTYYYCGKLLSLLFASGRLKSAGKKQPADHSVGFIQEYFQNTCKNREKMFTHPPYFLEKKLVSQITMCDENGAMSTLNEINMLNRAILAPDPLRSLKDSIICSCTLFTRAVIDSGVFPDIAFTYSDTFIQKIEKLHTSSEVRSYEREIVLQFIRLVRKNNLRKYSMPVSNAVQYIMNNLSRKLSLTDIARHAYVHPNYLSGLFKKETGFSVTEFIARHRIEESTYFVAYTDYEIADISNFYHFCNQSYFCTLFKRYLSVSPNQYRRERLSDAKKG